MAGGILNDGIHDTWLKSVTIAKNQAFSALGPDDNDAAGGVAGQHVHSTSAGKFYFANTIITNNTNDGWSSDCSGSVYTLGGNLIGSDSPWDTMAWSIENCTIFFPDSWPSNWPSPWLGDQYMYSYSQGPQLGPLTDNGGNTCTHALLANSPAIGKGWPGLPGSHVFACEAYDQRWAKRNGRCDIGAYEYRSNAGQLGLGCTAP
jgi:hypothetical protein